jgi:hypothetical protein
MATVAGMRKRPTAKDDSLIMTLNDMQHDAVLDYYGRRLATCSSDKTIKIFEVEGESHRLTETLKGYVDLHILQLQEPSEINLLTRSQTVTKAPYGAYPGFVHLTPSPFAPA